eukprot:gnl/TRDRNA2_/TRDRNA2_159415_c1_seq1.p1 gnl/TRDRNA2_/TRDRNA2_159415_c1~~gnl/TRDRNA2_/TRDRNA2_159415_c1_seq1.p1  ORF type:complete len:160 (-),score=15.55 gnl/TRDRNA2_/TRDRNA2_159415_c1_seq1:19-498(-)
MLFALHSAANRLPLLPCIRSDCLRQCKYSLRKGGRSISSEPWSIHVERKEHGGRYWDEDVLLRAKDMLCEHGFVILRGSSLYTDTQLEEAETSAAAELTRIKERCASLGLDKHVPWFYNRGGRYSADMTEFEFAEAVSYSGGRMDMPHLMDKTPFNVLP